MSVKTKIELELGSEIPEINRDISELLLKKRFEIAKILKTKIKYQYLKNFGKEQWLSKIRKEKSHYDEYLEFNFTLPERSILREASINVPEKPLFLTRILSEFSPLLELTVDVTIRKRSPTFEFREGSDLILKTKEISEVFEKRHELILTRRRNIQDSLENSEKAFLERKAQYFQHCMLLRANIGEYLSSNPQMEVIKSLNIEVKEKNFERVAPSKFKPSYNEGNNTLTLFEVHSEGEYHVNSSIKVHEFGVLIIFVTTFFKYSGRRKFHNAQAYFFFPYLKKFLNRNAKKVKEIGEIDDWELSFFNAFGYEDDFKPQSKVYERCYVCGSKLHYPAIPTRVLDQWVYLLKPCCSCFSKMEANERFKERAILKAIKKTKYIND